MSLEETGGGSHSAHATAAGGGGGVHTNRGNKVLLVKTPGIKVAGSFARGVVRQLEVGHIQKALRSAGLRPSRGTLFAARAAGAVCGASLAFLWV